jgi:hypothetical protein
MPRKKNNKTWRDKLTKKELKHLKESGITSLEGLKRTRKHQIESTAKFGIEACFHCRMIATKLGINNDF